MIFVIILFYYEFNLCQNRFEKYSDDIDYFGIVVKSLVLTVDRDNISTIGLGRWASIEKTIIM